MAQVASDSTKGLPREDAPATDERSFVDEKGEIYFLEINTLPGMTPTSLMPQEAAAVGIDYNSLCQKIVDLALKEVRA